MKDLFTTAALLLWCASCATAPPPYPLPIHSIQTITTVCPGPLCAICADKSEDSQ